MHGSVWFIKSRRSQVLGRRLESLGCSGKQGIGSPQDSKFMMEWGLRCSGWVQVVLKAVCRVTVMEDTGTHGAGDGIEQTTLKWELTLLKRSLNPRGKLQSAKPQCNTCLYRNQSLYNMFYFSNKMSSFRFSSRAIFRQLINTTVLFLSPPNYVIIHSTIPRTTSVLSFLPSFNWSSSIP